MQDAAKRKSKDGEWSETRVTDIMTEWEDVKSQFGMLEKTCRRQMEINRTLNKLEHFVVEYQNDMNKSKEEV